jgi:hypothetical protein
MSEQYSIQVPIFQEFVIILSIVVTEDGLSLYSYSTSIWSYGLKHSKIGFLWKQL